MNTFSGKLPGIILTVAIAIPAWLLGKIVPVFGGPIIGFLFGMVLALWKRPTMFNDGIHYTSKKLLQYSIIMLGFDMNLLHVIEAGRQSLYLMIFTLAAVCLTAYIAGKLLKLDRNTVTLIGVGSAICGGSAIAATAPVIRANDEEIAQAISTIFLFNVAAAFVFPILGHALNMSDYSFALWAGTAINDTSSVVAAGYAYSNQAGDLAIIVKLTRTLMIIPITLILAIYMDKQESTTQKGSFNIVRIFPWFIIGFIISSMVKTFTAMPADLSSLLAQAGKFIIIMAMAAVGLNTNIVKLTKSAGKPVLLGLICWVILSVTSIIVQKMLLHL